MADSKVTKKLAEVAERIEELRGIYGFSEEEMAQKSEVSLEEYLSFVKGEDDLPFSFVHKCALAFGVEMTDLLEGQSAKLSSYTVTRRGNGKVTANEDGKLIRVAHCFGEANAQGFKKAVLEKYPNANFVIEHTTGLCSFYAEAGGLMIGFEGGYNTNNNNKEF